MVEFKAAKSVFERKCFSQAVCRSKEKQRFFLFYAPAKNRNAKNTSSGKLIKAGCLQKLNEFIGERAFF